MYSQGKEEEIILDYFGDFVGTFCSVGENDGVTFSNVRALAERNWSGVCIEPSPKAYARLVENYKNFPNVYTYPYCISHANREFTLQESSGLLGQNDVGLVSTLHDHEKERFKSTVQYSPVQVKCFRWKTFLNRLTIKEFDFISCDCEGNDIIVLEQIDLSAVKLLCIEWNSVESVKNQILEITSNYGMNNVIYTSGENLIICRKS